MALVIRDLFNAFLRIGLPKSWNELLLVPVHKKGSVELASNCRGISQKHKQGSGRGIG